MCVINIHYKEVTAPTKSCILQRAKEQLSRLFSLLVINLLFFNTVLIELMN